MELNQQRTDDGGVVIAVDGEIDAATAPALRDRLIGAIEEDGDRATVLDLSACPFIDSSGLAVIIEAGQLLERRLQTLRIRNLGEQPRDLFAMTLVGEVAFIEVEDSV